MNKIVKNMNEKCNYSFLADEEPVNYETAISLVGFGRYNFYFLLLCFPTILANLFATSNVSYILTQAQCDLRLSLEGKGMLNAITYAGMIASGFLWGTLGDIYGRRTILVITLALEGICEIFASFCRTYRLLLIAKFFSGFMICGPVVLILTYISEFHHHELRPKLITIIGIYAGVAKIFLPLLDWLLISLHFDIIIIPKIIELKSWQCYILACSVVSIHASIIHYLLPESPKFLMSKGRYNEALGVFSKMFHENHGNICKTLPFSRLIDDFHENKKDCLERGYEMETSKLSDILEEVKCLFRFSICYKMLLVACINFGSLLGAITLRLWLPQFLTTIDGYYQEHNNTRETILCDMLNYKRKTVINLNFDLINTCEVPELRKETYVYYIVVPLSAIFLHFLMGLVVNKIGKRTLLIILPFLGGLTILINYFSRNSLSIVVLSSIYLALVNISSLVCTAVSIELFPTNLRAKAISFVVIFGRFGPLVGNVSFPFLLYSGCFSPFIFIACFAFVCSSLSLLLPNTEQKNLV